MIRRRSFMAAAGVTASFCIEYIGSVSSDCERKYTANTKSYLDDIEESKDEAEENSNIKSHSLRKLVTLQSPFDHEKRIDPYYWMRNHNDPAVLDYVSRQSEIAFKYMAPYKGLQVEIFNELAEFVVKDSCSDVWWPSGTPGKEYPTFEYYTKTIQGKQHPIHYRRFRKDTFTRNIGLPDESSHASDMVTTTEKIILDENELSKHFDTIGNEEYHLGIRDLDTGIDIILSKSKNTDKSKDMGNRNNYLMDTTDNPNPNADNRNNYLMDTTDNDTYISSENILDFSSLSGSLAWASDSTHLFFTTKGRGESEQNFPSNERSDSLWRIRVMKPEKKKTIENAQKCETIKTIENEKKYILKENKEFSTSSIVLSSPQLVYYEPDVMSWMSVWRSPSGTLIYASSVSRSSSAVRAIFDGWKLLRARSSIASSNFQDDGHMIYTIVCRPNVGDIIEATTIPTWSSEKIKQCEEKHQSQEKLPYASRKMLGDQQWEVCEDINGTHYFLHPSTGKTSWLSPGAGPGVGGWEEHINNDGIHYFWHSGTGETSWELPSTDSYIIPSIETEGSKQIGVGWTFDEPLTWKRVMDPLHDRRFNSASGSFDTLEISELQISKKFAALLLRSQNDGAQSIYLQKIINHDKCLDDLCPWEPVKGLWVEPMQSVENNGITLCPPMLSLEWTDFWGEIIRYGKGSLSQPFQWIEYNIDTNKSCVCRHENADIELKSQPRRIDTNGTTNENTDTLGPLRAYRVWATARDGVKIPISLVFRSDVNNVESSELQPNHPRPLLLDVYGCYGDTLPTIFNNTLLPLLNRGVVYAIAHVRGGGFLGRHWHECGRCKLKTVSVSDVLECCNYLVREEYTDNNLLALRGCSAGGTIACAALNDSVNNYKENSCCSNSDNNVDNTTTDTLSSIKSFNTFSSVVLDSAFLDVITVMSSPNVSQAQMDYAEFGDSYTNREMYDIQKQYSPYDNINTNKHFNGVYPSILLLSNIHDARVGFWESVKFVAKLQYTIQEKQQQKPSSQNNNNFLPGILLITELQSGGHCSGQGGGVIDQIHRLSLSYVFLIQCWEAHERKKYSKDFLVHK